MEDLISETAPVLSFSGYSIFLVNNQLEALFSMYFMFEFPFIINLYII